VVVSVSVEDVLNDEEVRWAVAVGGEERGGAPRKGEARGGCNKPEEPGGY
jgi:hypothetical protein